MKKKLQQIYMKSPPEDLSDEQNDDEMKYHFHE